MSFKIDFDIQVLIKALGGKDNIISSTATISTLKINVKDNSSLNKETFAKFKITGFMKNANQIILVFGDNAQAINNALIQETKN
jgi:phosphotransferase system IIB component